MRVVFMGTPDFSVPALATLQEDGHEIVCVYTQPPRPAGRGKKERPSPVQLKAETLGLSVRHPASLKDEVAQADFAALGADIAVVVAYGLILPQAVLDAPKLGCLNIHASLLPRWRGAAPIHRAIMAGDKQTGICIMQMEAGLDTGPLLLRRTVDIDATATTGELHDVLSQMGAEAVVEALAQFADLEPVAQPRAGVTYAAKIEKSEARLNWDQPADVVDQTIRGLSPFPGAWFTHQGTRIKVLGSVLAQGAGQPGEILDNRLLVACRSGAVRLTRLQRAGKGAQSAEEFLRGNVMAKGEVLGH